MHTRSNWRTFEFSKFILAAGLIALPFIYQNCGSSLPSYYGNGGPSPSVSETLAGAVGGAIAATDQSGRFAELRSIPHQRNDFLSGLLYSKAQAANSVCPTIDAPGSPVSKCSQSTSSGGKPADLTYSSCSFASGSPIWNGIIQLSLTNGNAVTCGSWPSLVGTTLYRQFVTASETPSTGVRISSDGTQLVIDHGTAQLGNFAGDTISQITNSGYGTAIDFDASGGRTKLALSERVYVSSAVDHSLNGTLDIDESVHGTRVIGANPGGRNSLTVYQNIARVKGNAVFTQVVLNSSCCYPVSGSIETTYTSDALSGATGMDLNGHSEKIIFTGCGTAQFKSTDGNVQALTLRHCH